MKRNKGFTLIELLISIAVIGILASVVLVGVNMAKEKGRDSRRITDITQLGQALENYFSTCYEYPSSLNNFQNSSCASGGTSLPSVLLEIPRDPLDNTPYGYYVENSPIKKFHVCATLEGDYRGGGKEGLRPMGGSDECDGRDANVFDAAGGAY